MDDTHPDLKNRVVGSIDFTNSDTEADQYGHGTQVAGVIVQNSPNNVKIKSYKIADSNGNSTMSYIVSALKTIASEQNAPKILNMLRAIQQAQEIILKMLFLSLIKKAAQLFRQQETKMKMPQVIFLHQFRR